MPLKWRKKVVFITPQTLFIIDYVESSISDRGIQYCCPAFAEYAEKNGFILSTTQQYDPYENAVAERVNGILKYEFGLKDSIVNQEIAKKMIQQAVRIYNEKRLHWSLKFKTPQQAHNQYNESEYVSYKKKKTDVVVVETFAEIKCG